MILPPIVRHLLVGCGNQVTTGPCGKIADDRRFEIGFWFHRWTLSNLGWDVKIVPHAEWPNAAPQPLPEAGARHERRLEAVGCRRLFGQDSTTERRRGGHVSPP